MSNAVCARWCAAFTFAGAMMGALLGWVTYDGSDEL